MISHPYFLVPHSAPSILLHVPICPQKPQPHVYRYFIIQGTLAQEVIPTACLARQVLTILLTINSTARDRTGSD